MRYAILAAGEGSRLAEEGIAVPKPLVEIDGEKLIDRLLRIFVSNGATEVCIVINNLHPQTEAWLKQRLCEGVPVKYVVKTTPSSMHSLYELSSMLDGNEPFVLTTVDTVFREKEFGDYISAWDRLAADGRIDGLMGVTDYIDDEKPLYVAIEDSLDIRAFLDRDDHPHYVSGGIYGLKPNALHTLRACIERGESRMRNFQRALLADGLKLQAWPFTKVLDIDHASDIVKAETFLRG